MNYLIPFVRKLEKIQENLGWDEPLLPRVVVVGAQGAGKSSVTENILGNYFLPHGEGLTTRCPIHIHLKLTENCQNSIQFEHLPGKKFTNWDEVKEEIKNETERSCGKHFGISTKPIALEFLSQHVPGLTIIDLPGLVEVAIGEQPPDISIQLKKLSMRYIKTPNTVILAVIPANIDMATNDCLMLCRMADTSGARTIVVVTKLDLAGPGVDLTATLTGQEVAGFRKIVGVVCRGQKCNKEKRKFEEVLKREKKFIHSKYPRLAREHGTPSLQLTLAQLLREHLRLQIPDFRNAVSNAAYKTETDVEALGGDRPDGGKVILEEITRYASAYCCLLTGNSPEIEMKCLVGGARISYIFQDVFSSDVDAIDPLEGLSRTQILTALRNTCGTRPDVLFIPEACFENLARRQVQLLLADCRRCVELVYGEMLQMIRESASGLLPERYPRLYDAIYNVTAELIERRYRASADLVEELLNMELGYINTLDPDFQRDLDISKVNWLVSRGLQALPTPNVEEKPIPKPAEPPRPIELSGWLSNLLSRRQEVEERQEMCPSAPPLPSNVGFVRISPKEDADCQLVENMIGSYITAVKRSMKDSVPKAIMLRLVNNVSTNLYHTLLEQLQQQKNKQEEWLKEPEGVVIRREGLTNRLTALKQAQCDLDVLQDDLRKDIVVITGTI